jgi:hypothetical protein
MRGAGSTDRVGVGAAAVPQAAINRVSTIDTMIRRMSGMYPSPTAFDYTDIVLSRTKPYNRRNPAGKQAHGLTNTRSVRIPAKQANFAANAKLILGDGRGKLYTVTGT